MTRGTWIPRGAIAAILVAGCMLPWVEGCASQKTKGPEPAAPLTGNAAQYRRLAIVCAPAPGADPRYVPVVLGQVERMAPSRLDFLEKADVLHDGAVNTTTRPPAVKLKDPSAYDAVVVLVYSYEGPVVLDMYMLDTRTRAEVAHHQLSTEDKDVAKRLDRHGFWTPTMIKTKFYGRS